MLLLDEEDRHSHLFGLKGQYLTPYLQLFNKGLQVLKFCFVFEQNRRDRALYESKEESNRRFKDTPAS